jgi:hypothetical protein
MWMRAKSTVLTRFAPAFALVCACNPSHAPLQQEQQFQAEASTAALPASRAVALPVPPATASASTFATAAPSSVPSYGWLRSLKDPEAARDTLLARFETPKGMHRVPVATGSFGEFLRTLPLEAKGAPVRAFNGEVIRAGDHPRVAAVLALDVGPFDVQQCADSIVRLHAEWQWSKGNHALSYRASSGFPMELSRWENGERMRVDGSTLAWYRGAKKDASRKSFREYLDQVFTFVNTVAVERDGLHIKAKDLEPGDFFVQGGFPGHAVIVLDLAKDDQGKRKALLAQGFMPAQSMHVLRNEKDEIWTPLDENSALYTPFWKPFQWSDLRRIK